MKSALIYFALFLMSIVAQAYTTNYACIINSLHASNGNVYNQLSDTDIDSMLTIPEMVGHIDAINAAAQCAEQPIADCSGNQEARIVAQVTNLDYSPGEAGNLEHTTFSLMSFKSYKPNPLCPLDIDSALKAVIYQNGYVNHKDGDLISGVLIYNSNFNIFSINN